MTVSWNGTCHVDANVSLPTRKQLFAPINRNKRIATSRRIILLFDLAKFLLAIVEVPQS